MTIKSLAHVCLKTSDLVATADFYCGALGMEKLFNFTKAGTVVGFCLKTGNETFIEVFHAAQVEIIDRHVLSHFCLQTDSIAVLRATLVWRGYNAGEVKLGADQTPQFSMLDPNGLYLEFQEYTPQSAQLTGEDVEIDW
jgi:catechol 2,3-dioxygenase-like lactoylglutathione lyase family enzyme